MTKSKREKLKRRSAELITLLKILRDEYRRHKLHECADVVSLTIGMVLGLKGKK